LPAEENIGMDEQNPYQMPASGLGSASLENPEARLFKVSGIGLATFLGSLLAGGLLMAMNFRALGQPEKARKTILYSIAAFAGVIVVMFVLPESIPGVVFLIPQVVAMVQLAKQYQQSQINERRMRGIPTRSNWAAAGISLLVFLALMLLAIAAFLGWEALGVGVFQSILAAD